MPTYTVGKTWSFKEYSYATFHAGDRIELEKDIAASYMHNEPGLLAPERETTQARAEVKRSRRLKK
jgi:hypothetical protein